jgi:hypothetical protein
MIMSSITFLGLILRVRRHRGFVQNSSTVVKSELDLVSGGRYVEARGFRHHTSGEICTTKEAIEAICR